MYNPNFDKEMLEGRINLVFWAIVVCFVVFFIGFWYLQVIRGPYYEAIARENILKEFPLPAPRGLILDRNNEILADNRLSHNLFITPGLSRNLENTLKFLSAVLAQTPQDLKKTISREGSLKMLRPVLVFQDLSLSQVAYISIRSIEYPELEIKQETKRSYRHGEFSHALGYVGELTDSQEKSNMFPEARPRDIVGQAGLELQYNRYLMGTAGYEKKVVTSYGMEVKEYKIPPKPPIPGDVLKLGLDYDMQKAAHDAFAEKEKYGSAVAINIKNGEVMVLFSDPYYNPNDFIPRINPEIWNALLADPRHPLQNRAIQNKFAPGSTFKVVMALAALQEGKITPETTFYCSGGQFIYNRVFHCWKPGGHGTVNLYKALTESCDVYFYNLGMRLDIDAIAKYARLLGLGDPTGIDLQHEASGLVPDREWKKKATGDKWYPGETISVAIGQGQVLVTALQMCRMIATVASGGLVMQPHLLSRIMSPNEEPLPAPKFARSRVRGIDPDNYRLVKQALWGVVNDKGTGTRARIPGYNVCGKTGTAQVVGYERGAGLHDKNKAEFGDHAWFVAFAPYQDPQVAVAVLVEHGGHGADAAAPVAYRILDTYFKDRKIAPYPEPDFVKKVPSAPPDVASLQADNLEADAQ
jgi:penicillin-binding protein 2